METRTTAALYARVSTQEQVEGYSLDAQVREYRVPAESRGSQPMSMMLTSDLSSSRP